MLPEERAVNEHLGKAIGVADPGPHFRLPVGIDKIRFVALEARGSVIATRCDPDPPKCVIRCLGFEWLV